MENVEDVFIAIRSGIEELKGQPLTNDTLRQVETIVKMNLRKLDDKRFERAIEKLNVFINPVTKALEVRGLEEIAYLIYTDWDM